MVFGGGLVETWNGFARDDQNVGWRGGADVAKGEDLVILVNDVSGNFTVSNLLKQRLAHGARIVSRDAMEMNFRALPAWGN